MGTPLESQISEYAATFCKNIRSAAEKAKKEEEIRIAVERELAFIEAKAHIKLVGQHEFTVASGFVDSVYQRVIIEYKNPASPSSQIGPRLESPGTTKVVQQIKSRFYDLQNECGENLNSLFGVGIDGRRFVFVRLINGHWDVQEPVDVSQTASARFIRALFNLGRKGKAITAANLAQDFGPISLLGRGGVAALYTALIKAEAPKTRTFFQQWKVLFSEVCGYDSGAPNEKLLDLARLYGIPKRLFKGPELLFALHTYYALLMKLLAAEIISFARGDTSPIQRMHKASTPAKFRREVQELEAGGIFRYLKITNFLEGDLFSWYAADWSHPIENLIRAMLQALDEYNSATLSEDPTETRDLLKNLYHELFPRTVRRALGEYYTPDWLAEHVLNDVGYDGAPERRLLDPSCGSGTFLVFAIGRIRKYYERHREQIPITEKELGAKILSNVVGFDLNPIAVMAARTNFLIAIRDLLPLLDSVEIPVYLCDSIVTPAEHGDLFSGAESSAKVPCVAQRPPYLLVPKEIAKSSESVAKYTEALQHSVAVSFSTDEFINYCTDEGIVLHDKQAHTELFSQLVQLQKENRNGIWARIIKNAFAPLFAGRFDFVVGNPPWVSWETLPSEYRKLSGEIWKHYRLQEDSGTKRRQASTNSKTDVSILMTYVAADKYLAPGGRLAFVITRTVFQSELGGWNFRRFALPGGKSVAIRHVHDLDYLKPFRGQAANITCTFLMDLEGETKYPVDWQFWRTKSGAIAMNEGYESVIARTERIAWDAEPIEPAKPQSAWIFGQKAGIAILRKLIGSSFYSTYAREGANTRGANGVYFADAWLKDNALFIANRPGDGDDEDLPRCEQAIEGSFLYPLLKGRDVGRWSAHPKSFIVLPHESARPTEPVPFGHLPKLTREYLVRFREKLSGRKPFRNFDPTGNEFYALYSVLDATFAQHKVVWREMANGAVAAVAGKAALPNKSQKVVIPDHKLFIIPCKSAEEAHFVAGVFNSHVSSYLIKSYALSTGISTHVLERLPIPEFDNSLQQHNDISAEAKRCSELIAKSSDASVAERKLNALVAEMLEISNAQSETISAALKEIDGTNSEGEELETEE